MSKKRKPCRTCGGPKPKGAGIKYCSDACQLLYHAEIGSSLDDCWGWNGYLDKSGYPRITTREGPGYGAHRFSHETWVGSIPENRAVFHICGNPNCVNPKHLKLGVKNSSKTHCGTCGRPFNENNTYFYSGLRVCKYCAHIRVTSERTREWQRQHSRKPEVRERHREYGRRYYLAHKEG